MRMTLWPAQSHRTARKIGLTLALSSAGALPAHGQEALAELSSSQPGQEQEAVFQSPLAVPELNPGWRVGTMLLRPSVTLSAGGVDDVRADGASRNDLFATVRHELRFERQSGAQQIDGELRGELVRYASTGSENKQTYHAAIRAQSMTRGQSRLFVNASVGRYTEDRTDLLAISNAFRPVQFANYRARAGSDLRLSRVLIAPSFALDARTFENNKLSSSISTPLDLSYRNVRRYGPALFVGYNHSPKTMLYAGGSYQKRDYTSALSSDRDGSEYLGYLGFRLQPSRLTRVHLSLGHQKRTYPVLQYSVSQFYYNGQVEWSPNRKTLLKFSAARELTDNSTLQSGTGVNTLLKMSFERSLRHDLQLKVAGSSEKTNIDLIGRKLSKKDLGASLEHNLSRKINLTLSAGYARGLFSERFDTPRPNFTQFRINSDVRIIL